jgi:hypothetical protein
LQRTFVRAELFRVTRAERKMRSSTNFFVEQNLFDPALNPVVRADAEFAQAFRTRVGLE